MIRGGDDSFFHSSRLFEYTLMAKRKKQTIVAEEIILKDSSGTVRAVLGFGTGEYKEIFSLRFFDKRGNERIKLGLNNVGTSVLEFYDDAGDARFNAWFEKDEPGVTTPCLTLSGGRLGKGQIMLYMTSDGGSLDYYDEHNTLVASFPPR